MDSNIHWVRTIPSVEIPSSIKLCELQKALQNFRLVSAEILTATYQDFSCAPAVEKNTGFLLVGIGAMDPADKQDILDLLHKFETTPMIVHEAGKGMWGRADHACRHAIQEAIRAFDRPKEKPARPAEMQPAQPAAEPQPVMVSDMGHDRRPVGRTQHIGDIHPLPPAARQQTGGILAAAKTPKGAGGPS